MCVCERESKGCKCTVSLTALGFTHLLKTNIYLFIINQLLSIEINH